MIEKTVAVTQVWFATGLRINMIIYPGSNLYAISV